MKDRLEYWTSLRGEKISWPSAILFFSILIMSILVIGVPSF